MAQRVIFHCDCNSFFASVELLEHPELLNKPVAVSGSVDNRRGIILAKNEIAKKFGVQTAETVWQAKKKCPQLVFLKPHHEKYRYYSAQINKIYESYSDRVEPFGIDESWLDMSGSWQLFGDSPTAVAHGLRKEVKEKTGLTISIGVSFNKIFAKLGSDYKKPDATTVITQENYQDILWPLPANAMLYVGKKAAAILQDLGISTIGQLALADEELLLDIFGKQGSQMHRYACGEDDSPVLRTGEGEPIKSVGNGITFKRNLQGYNDIRTGVVSLADEVGTRLREHHLYAGGVQILIKNPELKSITRQKPMAYATNLSKDLADACMELVLDHWDLRKPIRMLTVTAQQLTDVPFATQTNMFEEQASMDKKRESLEKSMDTIRRKYGKNSVMEASVLSNDIGLNTASSSELEWKKDEKESEE